jgi:K+-sensing histidine kinase KdpD
MDASTLAEECDERPLVSHFAPAERSPQDKLVAQAARVGTHPVVQAVLDAVTGYVLLLDARRQILAVNDALHAATGVKSRDELIGLRPGDALGCERAASGPNGCGTSTGCHKCGALLALLAAQDAQKPVTGHCLMNLNRDNVSLCAEFAVRVKKVIIEGDSLWVCILTDVTASRRRELLERLFLHDSRNVLMGLLGWGEWLCQTQPSEASEQIVSLARRLTREMDEQQLLYQAELGTLDLQRNRSRIGDLLDAVLSVFRANECAKDRTIEVHGGPADDWIVTDERLLVRVLVNLVQNALEATPIHGTVSIEVVRYSLGHTFIVRNPGEISDDVARQLFRARFSTKGEGRGLGSHAIRLFGEGCLGGKLSFESDRLKGTSFRFELPRSQKTGQG